MEVKTPRKTAPINQILQMSSRMYERSMKSIEKLNERRKQKIEIQAKQTKAKTAPVDDIIEISDRMHQRSMRSKQKLNQKIKQRVNPQEQQKKQKCTFKPNTYKSKFAKYPDSNTYKSKVNLKIKPMTQDEKASKVIRKPIPQIYPQPFQRMAECNRWDDKRKTAHTSQYFQTEIQRSLEKDPQIKRTTSSRSQFSILNKSFDDTVLKMAGTQHFMQRQERAKQMRQKKQFLLQNPTSHTWNFKRKLNSSVDTLSSQYLDFGDSAYSRNRNK